MELLPHSEEVWLTNKKSSPNITILKARLIENTVSDILSYISTHSMSIMDSLIQIPWSDLQSFFLELFKRRVQNVSVSDILHQYEQNDFVCPCDIDQRTLIEMDNIILKSIPSNFDAIEIAPVNPIGLNSVMSSISQKNILTTIRNTEVVADNTTVLALEAVKRRRKIQNESNENEVNLCGIHRLLRTNRFPSENKFTQHFKMLSLVSAGRVQNWINFEIASMKQHIKNHLNVLLELNQHWFLCEKISVAISDMRILESILQIYNISREQLQQHTNNRWFDLFDSYSISIPKEHRNIPSWNNILPDSLWIQIGGISLMLKYILEPLWIEYPEIDFYLDFNRIAGIGYYNTFSYKIQAHNSKGDKYPLVDWWFVDWSQKLLQNKKERMLVSWFGSEFFCRNFRL